MTRKMMKIFALMMACMMVLLVSAVSYAEEASTDIFTMEAPVETPVQEEAPAEEVPAEEPAPAEEPVPAEEPAPIDEPTPAEEPEDEVFDEEFDDDDLVEIDDDWGYVSRELIEQHTPEMTQEFIHVDDPDWVPEGKEKPAADKEETAEEPQVNEAEETVETDEGAVAEGTEETEETEVPAEEVGEETEEEQSEETAKVTVTVRASMRSDNLMHLKAEIIDPEGREYGYQWQVSVDGGKNYEDVEDAEEDFFDVELDEENVTNLWRVRVHAIG